MNKYKENLVKVIEAWRLRDSDTDLPVGWQRWAKDKGVSHPNLFRFCKDGGDNTANLGPETLHKLAAAADDDQETIAALAAYALGVDFPAGNECLECGKFISPSVPAYCSLECYEAEAEA
jgi:hypothetical protein